MARVKRGVTSHAKHKKVLKAAKGYYGRRKNTIRIAKQAVEKANQYAYRDRKRRKRTFRALWIQRLNAAVRPVRPDLQPIYRRPRQGRGRWSTARCCPISRSASRRPSRRSSRRPTRRDAAGILPRSNRMRRCRASRPASDDDRDSMSDLANSKPNCSAAVAAAADEAALEAVRVAALGKSGSVSALLKTLGAMTPDERKEQGPLINGLKDRVTAAIAARRDALSGAALDARLNTETVDVTCRCASRRRRPAASIR